MTSDEAVFRNKVIWLTGASTGIGAALAKRLAKTPCRLAITARRADLLQNQVQELSRLGAEVRAFPGDVSSLSDMQRCYDAIEDVWGGVHILIANAGTHSPTTSENFQAADCARLMGINYVGVLNCIETVLPGMKRRKFGHIVGVSSVAGYRGLPSAGAYVATKAALTHFLESMRFDLEPLGIDITVVSPGFVRTPLTDLNDFPMPCLVEPEFAAEKIFLGIARRRMEIHFPWQFTYFLKFLRILPYPLYHFLVKKFAVRRPKPENLGENHTTNGSSA